MTIIVKTDEKLNDFSIIEVQGDLESRTGGSLFSQFVGDLHFSKDKNNTPILIIGHHILHGKSVKLQKPFAIMKKVRKVKSNAEDEYETEYIVEAIIKKKLLFNVRPKPIIANVPKIV